MKIYLTAEQAEDCLKEGDSVRVISQNFMGLNLSDSYFDKQDALDLIRNAEKIEIGDDVSRSKGCGIVVKRSSSDLHWFLLEHDDEKLLKYDTEQKLLRESIKCGECCKESVCGYKDEYKADCEHMAKCTHGTFTQVAIKCKEFAPIVPHIKAITEKR